MPTNIEAFRLKLRQHINKILTSDILNYEKGLNFSDLVRELSLSYPVSPFYIEQFIKKFYVETNIVIEKKGYLIFNKKKEEKSWLQRAQEEDNIFISY